MSDDRTWRREDVAKLRKAYTEAKAKRQEVFKFEGNDVLTAHVEQLLQVLEARMKKGRS